MALIYAFQFNVIIIYPLQKKKRTTN